MQEYPVVCCRSIQCVADTDRDRREAVCGIGGVREVAWSDIECVVCLGGTGAYAENCGGWCGSQGTRWRQVGDYAGVWGIGGLGAVDTEDGREGLGELKYEMAFILNTGSCCNTT